jgi:hypothetical protein
LQSQTFDNASWTKTNSSITANAATAPDGTLTGDKHIPDNGATIGAGATDTRVYQSPSVTSGSSYTLSIYAKAGEYDQLAIAVITSPTNSAIFSLTLGTVVSGAGATITSVGNGWYRCTLTFTATSTGSLQIRWSSESSTVSTGDGTSGIYAWGAQLAVGPNALDYTPTTTAVVYGPRFDYNPSTLVAQGLLIEEQRTNSIRNNTMVGASAPSTLPTNWLLNVGGLTIGVVGTGTENGIAYIDIRFSGTPTQTFASVRFESNTQVVAANGQTWTNSFYVRRVSGSNTNITSFENRIFYRDSGGTAIQESSSSIAGLLGNTSISGSRTTFAYTSSAATTAFVNSAVYLVTTIGSAIDITLRIGLPQLEQGAFATSVIPTTTAATTRSADIASIGTLSPWYNATEGTLFAEWSSVGSLSDSRIVYALSDGTFNNVNYLTAATAAAANQSVNTIRSSNTAQATIAVPGAYTNYTDRKTAAVYKVNDFAISGDGSAVAVDTSGLLPVGVDRLALGTNWIATSNFLSGYLRRITYTPRRLTDAELQSLTS